jgi:hypothetical protein
MAKKLSVRQARNILALGSDDEKEAVRQELLSIAGSNLTDVIQWDVAGNINLIDSASLPAHVQKSIKKIKVTPGAYGNSIEVEMHDKLAALRVMARYHGLTEPNSDSDTRPSILGINLKGPEVAEYKVIDKDDDNKDDDGGNQEDGNDNKGRSDEEQGVLDL